MYGRTVLDVRIELDKKHAKQATHHPARHGTAAAHMKKKL